MREQPDGPLPRCLYFRSPSSSPSLGEYVPPVGAAVPGCPAVGGCRCHQAEANTQDPVGAVINRPKCPIIDLCVEWYNVGLRCVYAGQSTIDNIVPRGRLIGNYGMIATGNHGDFRFAVGRTTPRRMRGR